MSDAASLPSTDRLLAIISLQNEIAAARLDFAEIMRVVVRRARELTGASAAVVELLDGDEMVYRAASGTAADSIGLRLRKNASLSGRCVELAVPLCCDDVAADPRVDLEACRRVGVRFGCRMRAWAPTCPPGAASAAAWSAARPASCCW